MMRYKLESISDFITKDLLRMQKGTLAARYGGIFMVFFTSGLCHVMMDVWSQIPLRECRAMDFFYAQAFGIMLEDGVQALYRKARGVKRTDAEPKFWIKAIGFMWTMVFVVWSTPMWIYPGMRNAKNGPRSQLLPFSVVKKFLQ
jgi:hypothetical protein